MTYKEFKRRMKALGAKRRGLRLWVTPIGVVNGLGLVDGDGRPFIVKIALKSGQVTLWIGGQLSIRPWTSLLWWGKEYRTKGWIAVFTLWKRTTGQWFFIKSRTRPLENAGNIIEFLQIITAPRYDPKLIRQLNERETNSNESTISRC